MFHLPILNQGSLNICYAYAAAQIVDAYRYANRDFRPHRTSPFASAVYQTLASRHRLDEDLIEFDNPADTVSVISAFGSCSESAIVERIAPYAPDGFVTDLRTYFNCFLDASRIPNAATQKKCASVSREALAAALRLENISPSARITDFNSFLGTIIHDVCKTNSISFEKPIVSQVIFDSGFIQDPIQRRIFLKQMFDERLKNRRSLPVGIGYCADLLRDKSVFGIRLNGEGSTEHCTLRHASVVVGRRKSASGTCQLLIRNSEGESCSGYAWDCEKGQIWVDEDRLFENMYQAFYAQ